MTGDINSASISAPDVGPATQPDQEKHGNDLLEQFYLTLRSVHIAARKSDDPGVRNIESKLQALFESGHTWHNAYEIEQLLCFVMTESQLDIELARRLAEAKTNKVPYTDIVEAELKKSTLNTDARRNLLQSLLNDLQWFYAKRIQYRAVGKRLMYRVSFLFVLALVTLFLMLFIQFFVHSPATVQSGSATTPAEPDVKPQLRRDGAPVR